VGDFERVAAMQVLGKNMARLRVALGLSQIKAAKRVDMHWRHWQKLEYGLGNPQIATVVRIAIALRTDLITLFSQPPKE
jgi:transcriptional regulator with XRE-family HTH domain